MSRFNTLPFDIGQWIRIKNLRDLLEANGHSIIHGDILPEINKWGIKYPMLSYSRMVSRVIGYEKIGLTDFVILQIDSKKFKWHKDILESY